MSKTKKNVDDTSSNEEGKNAQTSPEPQQGDTVNPAPIDTQESAEQNTADNVNNPDAGNAETAQVISDQMQTRGPSLMELTMAESSAAGRPALDAHAAADGVAVTRQDIEASSDSPVTAESTQANDEQSGASKEA